MLTKSSRLASFVTLLCLATAHALTDLVTPIETISTGEDAPIVFDTVRVYGSPYRNGTLREVAIGTHFMGPSDDTVRFLTVMSAAPRYVLLMNDTTTVPPLKRDSLGWRRNGSLSPRFLDSSGVGYQGCAVGDVDGDSITDMIYGRAGAPYSVFRAWWTGSSWQVESLPVGPFPAMTNEIVIADANNDGANEILVAASTKLYRLSWTGSAWTKESIYTSSYTCAGVAVGNFDTTFAGNEVALVTSTTAARLIRLRWSGSAWDTMTIFANSSVAFYDVAIGDFDPDWPGNELAVYNGSNFTTQGNFFLFTGAGANWSLTQVSAYANWSTLGEIEVTDVVDNHPGAEIVAVPGGVSSNPILIHKTDGLWYRVNLPAPGGTSYGIASGNVNKWRTTSPPSDELIITGNNTVRVYQQRALNNNDLAVTATEFPGLLTAVVGRPITVRMTIFNTGYTTQNLIPVRYRTRTGTVSETCLVSLAPWTSTNYTFTQTYTPTVDGSDTVKCFTDLASEQYRTDDTAVALLQVFVSGTRVGQLFNFVQFPPPGWQAILGPSATINWVRDTITRCPAGVRPLEGAGMARYACSTQVAPWGARLWTHKFNVGDSAQDVVVDFWMLNDSFYSDYYDSLFLEYTTDSLTWTSVVGWCASDPSNPGWNKKQVRLGSFSPGTNLWGGFRSRSGRRHDLCIDSVRSYVAPPTAPVNDVGLTLIQMPAPPILVGTPYPITVRIRNYGLATQTSIPVSYETDAGRVNETWTGTLLPGAVAQYTFTTPYTPADSGLFRMWAGTGLVSDTFNANDSLSVQFRVCLACHSAPYLKDFNEAWANSTNPPWCGWTIMDGGSDTVLNSNDWHRFERTSPPYRTVANIYYSPVEWSNDWLISPRLDCSVNGTYTLRFWHYYNDYTTGSPDSGLVLLSTDGGTTWPIQLARYSNADDSGYKTFDISAYVSGWDSVKVAFWYVAYDEMYWDIDDFLVSFAPLAPQLLSPGQDSLLSDNIPWFDWSEPAGANKYWFQLASDSLFTTRLFDDSSVLASEYQIATALPDGRYFWRVRASAGLWSEWTGTWRFGLDATAPAAPVLLAPPNHALVTTRSPCLTWGSVTLLDGATRYRVQVADDSMFGSPLVDAEVTDTSYIPAPLPEDIPLYWHVMATDTAGNPGSYSEIWEFTIDATAPSAPVLIAPANHATLTETKPTFIWSAASGEGSPVLSLRSGQVQLPSLDQVSYRLLCDDDPLFLSPAINVLLAETSYTPLVGLELGRWFWRVLALDSAGNAGPSETWDFTISALPLGWVARASVPEGPKAKKVKDGGCLGYIEIADSGLVYALKGNNRCEFYSYNPATYVWATKESIPILGSALKKKAVKRGGALVGVDVRRAGPRLLALKGNNSLEFWQYCPDTTGVYLWVQKPDVPAGARAIKEGSGLASVRVHHPHGEDSSFVFLLKGSGTNEFYRFSVQDESWTTMAPAPGGASGKPYKNGSCLTASEDGATVYCLKGSYNEFASYDVATNTWSTLAPLPLTGSAGRKKAKDGAALACAGGLVYALKGGNTLEFWQYKSDTVGGPAGWTEIEAIPTGSKKVKGGGALVYAPKAHGLFALKGNNTLEFYQYAFATVAQANDAQNATMGASKGAVFGTRLAIAPNPFSTRTTIRYTLSSHCLVSLGLYDLSGALVRTLANGTRPAGSHTCVLIPGSLPRGVYLLRLCVGPVTATEKLILE